MKRKDSAKRFGLLGAGLIVLAFLAWALVLPALNNKTANESLEDIVASPTTPQAAPRQSVSEPAMPAAPVTLPAPSNEPVVVSSNSFTGLRGKSASGKASLVTANGKTYLRLEDDFTVSNGPDLFVGFGNGGQVDSGRLVARLKANSGGQNYELPQDFDYKMYSQVFIHCKAFSYSFAVADLPQ